jgi:hypothetical protein
MMTMAIFMTTRTVMTMFVAPRAVVSVSMSVLVAAAMVMAMAVVKPAMVSVAVTAMMTVTCDQINV